MPRPVQPYRQSTVERRGVNGGNIRYGRSGGEFNDYYRGLYQAKGRGKAKGGMVGGQQAMNAYIAQYGPTPRTLAADSTRGTSWHGNNAYRNDRRHG